MGLCQCRNLDLSICTARCHFDVHMLQPQISSVALTVSSLLNFSELMNPHTPFPCYLIRDHSFHPVWTARTGSSAVQIFSGSTLRELDASAYEEAPALSPLEIAEELGRTTESAGHPGSSSRSLGGQRRSLGRHAVKCEALSMLNPSGYHNGVKCEVLDPTCQVDVLARQVVL